jgi:hypothetical protein
MNGATTFLNPLKTGPTVVVAPVGEAEGARGAAAAMACAGADADLAALLIDVGGRSPRPALLASAAAQKLEERLTAHLPDVRSAARGQVCHLAVPADEDGLAAAAAAADVAREATVVFCVPPEVLQVTLATGTQLGPTAVLLRADLAADRPLVSLVVRDLLLRELKVGVLKQRLSWVAERRALFGALPAGAPGGLSERFATRLLRPGR